MCTVCVYVCKHICVCAVVWDIRVYDVSLYVHIHIYVCVCALVWDIRVYGVSLLTFLTGMALIGVDWCCILHHLHD